MSINIRVLILEDRPEDAELMLHELRRSQFEPDWQRVETESEYNAHLGWQPDLILADYSMPLLDAPRALDLLRELDVDIPFIVVSGAIGEDLAVAMMRRGATDYLLKDRLARLGPAVRHALEEKKLRQETRRAEEALRASEVRFYAFMNHNPALTHIKDQDGRILYINNTCEQVWDKTLAECFGKTNHSLWPADLADHLDARDRAVLESGESSHMVEEISLPGGRTVHLLSFRFRFNDPGGRPLLGGVSVDISEQVRSQQALARALDSKEVLFRELHHRVKNNLQVVSSLLSMRAEALTNSAAVSALQETLERVTCMAMIHDRLYNGGDLDQVDFREYIEVLAHDLLGSYGGSGRIGLRLELEPVTLGIAQAVPCGLILNELITNALKHAFPGGRTGEIRVAFGCGPSNLVNLTVADNGIGLAADCEPRESASLGLRIVDILRRQLDGEVQRETRTGHSVTITFPRVERQATGRLPQQPAGPANGKIRASSAS
jgi:PAS domain S-box-containing protein